MARQTDLVRWLERLRLLQPADHDSLESFAERLGVHRNTVQGWLSGEHVPSEIMVRHIFATVGHELDGYELGDVLRMRSKVVRRRRRKNGGELTATVSTTIGIIIVLFLSCLPALSTTVAPRRTPHVVRVSWQL